MKSYIARVVWAANQQSEWTLSKCWCWTDRMFGYGGIRPADFCEKVSGIRTLYYSKKDAVGKHVKMLNLSCHCSRVNLQTEKRPDFIHQCNCTLCQKTGAIWGYFQPTEVKIQGMTTGYSRNDKPEPGVAIRFCSNCGATTHFELTDAAIAKFGNTMLGVNMRLAEVRDLDGIELRYPDGRAWSGEGDFGYVQKARIMGKKPLPSCS